MQLIKGADVFSSTGNKIGRLDKVVIDPDDKEVTHLIIEKGIFFTTSKVVPIQDVNLETGEGLALNKTGEELDELPDYDESSYVGSVPNDYPYGNVDAVYWYPPLYVSLWTLGGSLLRDPISTSRPRFVQSQQVTPEGSVALEEGAHVISKDDKHIGNLDRVILEPSDHHVTHIVVSEGFFLKEKKLVPAHWISEVEKDKVHFNSLVRSV